ncbi:MAG: POTRA domain-containing protein [Bacteroidota bacterium]
MGIFLVLLGSLLPELVAGQDSLFRQVKIVESNLSLPKARKKRIHRYFRHLKDSLDFADHRLELAREMSRKGQPEFSLDTFAIKGETLHLTFHEGGRYHYGDVAIEGLNEGYFLKAGFAKLAKRHAVLDWRDFQQKMAFCLNAYQNEGFPFARFDSLQIAYRALGRDSILADVAYAFDPGGLVRVDSIQISGDIRENDQLISSMIGINPGDAYNQERITNAPRILNSSVYFKNTKAVKVSYLNEDTVNLKIDVESRKAGKFDLLLGILPPRDDNSSRLEITGLIDFQLVSPIFKAGEILEFRFDKLVGSSQKMHLQYDHPYLFGSPMRAHVEFDLLKQDSSFLTRYFEGAAYYAFNPALALKVYARTKTSSLISTLRYEQDSTRVPPVLDARDQTYGVGFEFQNLDYRFNPRRGWQIQADFGIGRKRITRNPKLSDNIYENLLLNLPKAEADFHLAWYRAYSKRLVLKVANHTYWLDQAQYFQNDLLQVGGSRSIRGFNENQFFTNFYSLFTLENRFILEQNSYIFVFTDYAYLENQPGPDRVLRPWGLGLGLTYETKAGMVSLTYAVGRVKDFGFQPSRGRIHVGLINQF